MKDATEPQPMHFSLMSVELETGQNGKPVTSAVLRPSADFSKDGVPKLTDMQMLAIEAYEDAVKADGTLNPDEVFAGLHLDHWRAHFYRKHTGDSTGTKRQAFNRARKDLVEMKRFKVDNDVYQPAGDFAFFDVNTYTNMIKERDTDNSVT